MALVLDRSELRPPDWRHPFRTDSLLNGRSERFVRRRPQHVGVDLEMMHMVTPIKVEIEIEKLLQRRCDLCGSYKMHAITLETMAGSAVIEINCRGCDFLWYATLEWHDDSLCRCPVCHHAFNKFLPAKSPVSFTWPKRCRNCRMRFVDKRYPYKVLLLRKDSEPENLGFSRLEEYHAALETYEAANVYYLSRGPGWFGGCLPLPKNRPFFGVFNRIPTAAPAAGSADEP